MINIELIKNYNKWFKLKYELVYFYNVYGPGQIKNSPMSAVIGIFENQFNNNKPLTVVRPGTQKRDFTHIDDIVRGCYLAWKKGKQKEYSFVKGRKKPDFTNVVGVRLHQFVSRSAQPIDEAEFVVLEVFKATPDQIGRLLGGKRSEITPINMRYRSTTTGKRSSRYCAVDASTNDEYVKVTAIETSDIL